MRGMITVNVSRCTSCETCRLECAVAHSKSKSLLEAIRENPRPESRIRVEAVEGFGVPMQCRHCEDAPCVAVCPTGSLTKLGPEQPVLLKNELCIGCKSCVLVCPFGVIWMGREGRAVIKCDLCFERLQRGQKPACVSGCPTGALRFETTEEVARRARRRAAEEYLVLVEGER